MKQKKSQHDAVVVWPKGAQERYNISAWTRWNWETAGHLPPRDFKVGPKTGWRKQTLDAWDARSTIGDPAQ